MPRKTSFGKSVCQLVLGAFLSTSLYLPAAQAAMVTTQNVIQSEQAALADLNKERLGQWLARGDVQARLMAWGVDPQQALSRVDALTDEELRQLAAQLDTAPAGGDALVTVLLIALAVFTGLLVTDILGYTDIFPFVVKNRKK